MRELFIVSVIGAPCVGASMPLLSTRINYKVSIHLLKFGNNLPVL